MLPRESQKPNPRASAHAVQIQSLAPSTKESLGMEIKSMVDDTGRFGVPRTQSE
jgi:hypothetical protein